MTMLIDARSLGKRYERGGRPFWALRGASLQVASGDFVTVLGRSGSGKSTLLNILVGLLPPTEGSVSLMGEDISKLDDAKRSGLRNAHVGYVPQSAGLIPTLTILENVRLPWYLAGERGAEPEGRAEALLEEVGLKDLGSQFPSALSGGELRRVAIARALMCSPDVIVADEPTSNLDPASARGVVDIFRAIAQKGGAVLMVTHDTFSLDASTRLYDMAEGRLEARTKSA
ncbi:ABC transporter ATP-binding protein [uncultured Sutterella sp.]|uniref:ABC transporter ATP-binding protein n=1 Tax=uncultured Sutterella sp. TaxID=286133 RepID=UPI002621A22A|nr:ABC transporter ATP-binding protein [uncultured Sutterella sp.]